MQKDRNILDFSRRAALAGLLFVAAGISGARAADADAFGADLYAKAKAAGETKVSYYTSMVPPQFDAVMARWKQLYPDIAVEYVRADLGQILERVLAENRAKKYLADVISNNEASFASLQKENLLAKFESPTRAKWIEPFKSHFNGYQFPSRLLQIGLAVNTDKVKEADFPRKWTDLTDPKWKGRIGVPDPRVGGGAQLWFLGLWDRPGYGEKYFSGLYANDALVKPGIIQLEQSVELGEVDVDVVAYDYVTLPARKSGKPVAFVLPRDGTFILATYDSVAANAPHPNAAKLLAHFLMTKDAQEALTGSFVTPVNGDVALNPNAPDRKGVEVLMTTPTEAQLKNMKTYVDHMNKVFNLR